MREPIRVEKMKADDLPEMSDWMSKLSHRNNIDTAIFNYPATDVLKASNGKGIMYMPRQRCTFLEALAINPEASPQECALAFRALLQVAEYEARVRGEGELYFLCSDAQTKEFARHHGCIPVTPAEKETDMQLFERKL